MNMTIKQLANSLGVSKPTVSKIMTELSMQAEKIGNKYVLDETQISQIKSQIKSQKSQNENINKSQNSQIESQKLQIESQNSQKSQIESQNSQMLQFLQSQLEEKDRQLEEKDKQLAALTSALENTTAALKAAQALHAGTIQERLTEFSEASELNSLKAAGEAEAEQNIIKPNLKQRFKYLFFGK